QRRSVGSWERLHSGAKRTLERGDSQHELRARPTGLTCDWGRNFIDTLCAARDIKRLCIRVGINEDGAGPARWPATLATGPLERWIGHHMRGGSGAAIVAWRRDSS